MKRKGDVSAMAAMARGRRRVDQGDLRAALAQFDKAVRVDAHCAQAVLYRAGLKLLMGDQDGAVADFRAMSKLDHSFLPAYRDLTTLSAEEFPALIAAADVAVKRAPDCAWAWVFRAFSLRSLMLYEKAVRDLDRAVSCEPKSAALWALRSRVKLTNRQAFYDGVKDMEKAVELAPRWGWLHCWLGEALRHQGKFKSALACFNRGLKLEPGYLRGWAWRGGTKIALGDYRGARRDLDRSLAWDPIYSHDFEYTFDQKSWAYNQRHIADRRLEDVRRALRDLNMAHRFGPRYAWIFNPKNENAVWSDGFAELERYLVKHPRDHWGWAWLAMSYHQAGREDAAFAAIARARTLAPLAAWPAAWEGKILSALGRPKEGEKSLSKAVMRDPDYAPAWGWRAQARRAGGDIDGAIKDFSVAIRLDHRAAWAFAGRGEARAQQSNLLGAREDLDRALGILPDYAEALGWRAEVFRRQGDTARSLADANRALILKPGLVLVYVTRALVCLKRKDYTGQLRDLRRAARLAPDLFVEKR